MHIRNYLVAGFTAVVVAFAIAGCSPVTNTGEQDSKTYMFTNVSDHTRRAFYTVGSTATAVTDSFGTTLTLTFNISNANQTIANPKAVISFQHGRSVTCQETDLRRLPSLNQTPTTWDLPCNRDFPKDTSTAQVTVTYGGN